MADERTKGSKPARHQPSSVLLEALQKAIAADYAPSADDDSISLALRAIGAQARAEGIRAEQLVKSLKRTFDAVTPPPALASQDARGKRLSTLVTICVREYYAPWSDGVTTTSAPPVRS